MFDQPSLKNLTITACSHCRSGLCRATRVESGPQPRNLQRGQRFGLHANLKLWTVLDGLVAQCTTLPDGRRQIIALFLPGDVICTAVGGDNEDGWVEALTASSLCELDLTKQMSAFGRDPELSTELFRLASKQVRNSSTHLVALGRLDGMERVCLFLADMAWRIGRRTTKGWRVHLPLSREDIADYLGLNAETVSRILGRVKKAKLATFLSPTDCLVPDIEKLARRAPVAAPNEPRHQSKIAETTALEFLQP